MDIKDIKTVIELMKRHDLTHFELEREGMKLVLKKNIDPESIAAVLGHLRVAGPVVGAAGPAIPVAGAPGTAAPGADAAEATRVGASVAENDGVMIKSPMVGTFFRAPGPGQDPFVKVGDYVEAETTVCIIEAMKVMNEIKAECVGRIARIVIDDATPVAYGQALFEVKP